jgi:TPR repeat protein
MKEILQEIKMFDEFIRKEDPKDCIGFMYTKGIGVHKDHKKAIQYYILAAEEQGSPRAQNILGNLYHYGIKVPRDDNKSFHYFTLAANQGYANAYFNLFLMQHNL